MISIAENDVINFNTELQILQGFFSKGTSLSVYFCICFVYLYYTVTSFLFAEMFTCNKTQNVYILLLDLSCTNCERQELLGENLSKTDYTRFSS